MKKKIMAMLLAAVLCISALALAGCGGSKISFTVTNDTNWDMHYCYINACTESEWGDDLLSGDVIAAGESYTFEIGSADNDSYDIWLVDLDGDGWVFYGVTLEDGDTASLTAGPVLTFSDGTTVDGEISYASEETETAAE